MAGGIIRSVILLPAGAEDWTEERARFVIAHELAHVRRHDIFFQVLVQIACATYWFNPLVWYAATRLRLERERARDDSVLSLGANADHYASHLLEIARCDARRRYATVGTPMAQVSQLERRLRSIVDRSKPRARLSPVGSTAVFLTAVPLLRPFRWVDVSSEVFR